MFNHPPEVCIDVAAFNDVAVLGRTRPRSLDELRAGFDGEQVWAEAANWGDLHRDYVGRFDAYSRDPDTSAWRDARKKRIAKVRR